MLIQICLRTNEPVALTDEPPVFCRLSGRMPVIGLTGEKSETGWPDRAWLFEVSADQMAELKRLAQEFSKTPEESIYADDFCTKFPLFEEKDLVRAADRYFGRPWKITETKRLLIREMCVQDAADLMAIYQDEAIRRYIEALPDEKEAVEELIRSYIRCMYELIGFGIWVMVEKESGKLIGRAGFEPEERGSGLSLGFLLADFARGKGYAAEACKELLHYAQEELYVEKKEIRCHIAPDNLASRKLAEKLGIEIVLEVNWKNLQQQEHNPAPEQNGSC